MNKDRFDFLEIDVAIPAAEKMQQEDRTAVVLENNCKVVGILNEKVEKLENRLAEALSAPDETVSSFHKASRVTVGEDSRRVLEQEGDAICRKTTEMIGKEGKKLMDRLSMRDRTTSPRLFFGAWWKRSFFFWRLSSAPVWSTHSSSTTPCCGKCSVVWQDFSCSALG